MSQRAIVIEDQGVSATLQGGGCTSVSPTGGVMDEEIKELREEGCSCSEQFLVGFGTSGKVKCMTCAKPEAKRSLRIPAAR